MSPHNVATSHDLGTDTSSVGMVPAALRLALGHVGRHAAWEAEQRGKRQEAADREVRIQSHIDRIWSDPVWLREWRRIRRLSRRRSRR